MVKKLVLIVALALFLKPILPVLDYVINYDYIVKELCENKAKPELKCNGKCHLMKEMAKAAENEKPINSDKKDNSKQEIEVLFYNNAYVFHLKISPRFSSEKINNLYTNHYDYLSDYVFFHPPSCIV
jgi:hypothetical protein